jgi:dTDP-4-dehydrorhamnose 3,5-epimerase-like enzyme
VLPSVKTYDSKKMTDLRDPVAELFREDWRDFMGDDYAAQLNFSINHPKIIIARHWYSHTKIGYLVVLRVASNVCALGDTERFNTMRRLGGIVSRWEKLQVVSITGHCRHETEAPGNEPLILFCFTTELYDYGNRDEERRSWNDPMITDPEKGGPQQLGQTTT